MRQTSLLRSGAFRFAVLLAVIFAIGTVVLLIEVERSVEGYATEVANDSISTEVAALRDEDRTAGRAQMIQSILRRENAVREHQLSYLLVDNKAKQLVGNLPPSQARLGWQDLTAPVIGSRDQEEGPAASLKALGVRLSDGATLVVASDTSDLKELRRSLVMSTAEFGMGISLLALIGGLVVGTLFLRRLDGVNNAIERILQGSMSERLPAIGMGGEFDVLLTNLNRMLDRIEALMSGLRQVSTDIAHDLRTPLTRLRQRLEDMKEGLGRPELISEAKIDEAIEQMDSILAIFRALLRISTLEAGVGKQRFAEVDLSEILERIFHAYRPVAEDSGHNLSADIEPALDVLGDGELLTQAITNLIENGLAHTPSGSHIRLSLARTGDGITLAVVDDGPGIPASEHEMVLRRFYRLDGSRHSPGSGLGLALVKAIAALHEARLKLSDNWPGLRAEMIFYPFEDRDRQNGPAA